MSSEPPRNPPTLVQYGGGSGRTTMSAPCGKVHMALRFKNIDYRVKNLVLPSQVKRYNPRGRVPVLLLDDATVVDSTDVLSFLDERFPDPPLLPAEAAARARCKIYEDWADEVIYFYVVYLRWLVPGNFERMRRVRLSRLPLPARWIAPRIAIRTVRRRAEGQGVGLKDEATVRRELHECLEALNDLLHGTPFLADERMTRADIAVCAILDQLALDSLTPAGAADLISFREITAWRDRVHERAPSAAG